MQSGEERTVEVNGVELCTQAFGDTSDPTVLLVGNSMLAWDAEMCRRLAEGGRYVVRYDQRDTGRSTTVDPDDPAYTLRDLVADAVGLLDALGVERAHVMGVGPGGWIAQLLALDHPSRVRTLVIIGSRPVAPGPTDDDLPDHDQALLENIFSAPEPDWGDREAALEALVVAEREFAGSGPFDEAAVGARSARSTTGPATPRRRAPTCRRASGPTTWGRCSPTSTAATAGANASARSGRPRWSCTVRTTGSSRSATGGRWRPKSRARGSTCSPVWAASCRRGRTTSSSRCCTRIPRETPGRTVVPRRSGGRPWRSW